MIERFVESISQRTGSDSDFTMMLHGLKVKGVHGSAQSASLRSRIALASSLESIGTSQESSMIFNQQLCSLGRSDASV